MRRIVFATLAVCMGALWTFTAPDEGDAIPAFARKYKVSCSLCHQPFPRLTPLGEMFAGNGFELGIGEPPVDTVETQDPNLRLQAALPLAVRVDAYMSSLFNDDGAEGFDLQTPWGVKLLSGGQVSDLISYYMYFYMSERGEVAGLEDAYIQFTDIGGTGFNLMVGQFQVSDPLFKRELRLEVEDYHVYRARVGEVRSDLAYERGLMGVYSPVAEGDLIVQVVNGQGIGEATGDRLYDPDNRKNVAVRYSQGFGRLRAGAFVYFGGESSGDLDSNSLTWGPDLSFSTGNTEVNLQYLRRTDENPFFLDTCSPGDFRCVAADADPFETTTDGVLGEVIYSPKGPLGRWHFTGLYNWIETDRPALSLRLGEQNDPVPYLTRYQTAALGASYVMRTNVRALGEVMWDLELEQARFTLGFVTGF
ncbi:MAG: hypothetical protein OEO23_04935 [Gemmatimonadota bacterium]|nr:hypothetical protein [Gemmatimonadota bacterium]